MSITRRSMIAQCVAGAAGMLLVPGCARRKDAPTALSAGELKQTIAALVEVLFDGELAFFDDRTKYFERVVENLVKETPALKQSINDLAIDLNAEAAASQGAPFHQLPRQQGTAVVKKLFPDLKARPADDPRVAASKTICRELLSGLFRDIDNPPTAPKSKDPPSVFSYQRMLDRNISFSRRWASWSAQGVYNPMWMLATSGTRMPGICKSAESGG